MTQDPYAALKQAAAERAVDFVQSGHGGRTRHRQHGDLRHASHRRAAARRHAARRDRLSRPRGRPPTRRARSAFRCSATSCRSAIDLTIDGADEVDPQLDLIKGGGGALLREKIVAQASRREIIVVDESKLSPVLGTRWALPIEVIPFGWRSQARFIEALGGRVVVRQDGHGAPFRTDQGNIILDCAFGPIARLQELAQRLAARAGIVEHGLFLGIATDLIVAGHGRHPPRATTLGGGGVSAATCA